MNGNEYRLERLEFPRDRELLRSFHRMYDAEYGFSREESRENAFIDYVERHQDTYHCLVLYEGSTPLGYMRGYDRLSTSSCDVVFMLDLVYVHPGHRGRGLGREMVSRLLEHVSKCGGARIDLLADVGNEAAQRLYLGFGFKGRTRLQMHRFIKPNADLDRYFEEKVESEKSQGQAPDPA